MFIDIQGGSLDGKLTIGNIYRPPKNNNSNACVEKFLNELSPIISKLCKKNNNTVITGDMNLDLLKIDEREKFQAYFDLFVTHRIFWHYFERHVRSFPVLLGFGYHEEKRS